MERKYSIVLTVYNADKYLEKCLDSITSQTYDNWELILVNDGSTDKSGDIACAFLERTNSGNGKSSAVYLEHDNKGAVYSRERGICKATGDYLLFIDADDYYDSNLIETVNETVDKSQADIIQFGYKFVDEFNAETTDDGLYRKGGSGISDLIIENDNNIFSYKALTICYSLWSRAFKRCLFDKEEGFYSDYYDVNMTNDLLALARPLSLAKSFCFTDYYLYNYRILDSSLCHDVTIKKICSYFKSLSWAEKCLRMVNGLSDEHFEFFSRRIVNIVFDEYRDCIYSAKYCDVKKIYKSSESVDNVDQYLVLPYKMETDWYKRLHLKSFIRRWVLLPKALRIYTNIRNISCNKK